MWLGNSAVQRPAHAPSDGRKRARGSERAPRPAPTPTGFGVAPVMQGGHLALWLWLYCARVYFRMFVYCSRDPSWFSHVAPSTRLWLSAGALVLGALAPPSLSSIFGLRGLSHLTRICFRAKRKNCRNTRLRRDLPWLHRAMDPRKDRSRDPRVAVSAWQPTTWAS